MIDGKEYGSHIGVIVMYVVLGVIGVGLLVDAFVLGGAIGTRFGL